MSTKRQRRRRERGRTQRAEWPQRQSHSDERPQPSISTPRVAQLSEAELERVPAWARLVHSVPQAATVTVLLVLSIVLYSAGGVAVGSIVSGVLFILVALALWRGEAHLKRAQRDETGF